MKPVEGESRRLTRASILQIIMVRDVMRDMEVGRIVNLHEEGFMIIGGTTVKENCLYQMRFLLSEPVDGVSEIDVGAECLWIRETADDDRNWAGFHIIDLASANIAIITKLKQQIDR